VTAERVTAVVVPTLGRRPEYLPLALRSIRDAGECHILLVAPAAFDAAALIAEGLVDEKIDEVGRTLPDAINQGFAALAPGIEFIAWLGDDDLLRPGSLVATERFLREHPGSSAAYGRCDYIDETGAVLWTNRSGAWAAPLLRVGPDLIPQPGSLFRRSAFVAAGGLRTDLGWAFDLDLFLRLARFGKLSFLGTTLAAFRWHADSLSVGQRDDSVREASQVRREFLPAWLRPVSGVWEGPVRWATNRAGDFVGGNRK
jgi:hypothetical protein